MYYPHQMISSVVSLILPAGWAGAVRILLYAVNAMGLYTLASSRRIKGAWLSWIPVADMWILGALSDQYQYVVKGRVRSRRVLMLVLQAVIWVLWAVGVSLLAVGIRRGAAVGAADPFALLANILHTVGIVPWILAACAAVLGLWLLIVKLMALYDLFRSCDPNWAVLYLILSIVVPSSKPVLLFLNRDKEAGMPPRIPES